MTLQNPVPVLRATIPLLLALFMGVASLAAQSADEVVRTALERWDDELDDVNNVALVREMTVPTGETITDTTHLEKRTIDGHDYLVPPDIEDPEDAPRVQGLYEGLTDAARYDGIQIVDSHECHVLVVDDAAALDRWLGAQIDSVARSSGGEVEMSLKEGRAYLDTESYALRKQTVSFEVTQQGRTAPVDYEMTRSEYREVDGLSYPHRTVTRILGLTALTTGAMSPEELQEAKEGLREMEERLEEMPPQQRQMAEAAMGHRMEQMRQMLESGAMETVIEVVELRVEREPGARP